MHAILAHADKAPRETLMDHALWCADPTTGFIVAAALVRPDKELAGVEVRSAEEALEGEGVRARRHPRADGRLPRSSASSATSSSRIALAAMQARAAETRAVAARRSGTARARSGDVRPLRIIWGLTAVCILGCKSRRRPEGDPLEARRHREEHRREEARRDPRGGQAEDRQGLHHARLHVPPRRRGLGRASASRATSWGWTSRCSSSTTAAVEGGVGRGARATPARIPESLADPPWPKKKPFTADGVDLKTWKLASLPYLVWAPDRQDAGRARASSSR